MAEMNAPHRSRQGWSDAMDCEPPAPPAHTHRLPKAARLALIGLTAAVFLLLVAIAAIALALVQFREFIEGRGDYRERETVRLEQAIDDSLCDLLDEFPQGGLLDRPRAKYGCGPGLPLDLFPPEVRDRYSPPTGNP